MPNYKTPTATAQDAALGQTANFASRPDSFVLSGKVHRARVQYTLLGTEAATETLKLCHLPKGARVIPGMSKVSPSADPGTALVVDIGTSGDPDAFADGLVLTAGERAFFDTPALPAASGADLDIGEGTLAPATPDDQVNTAVFMTFMTATVLTAGVKLNFDICYALHS